MWLHWLAFIVIIACIAGFVGWLILLLCEIGNESPDVLRDPAQLVIQAPPPVFHDAPDIEDDAR